MRVAVYARYSSDHQSERSIDDQVSLCREHADRQGWQLVEVFADYALSGAHLQSRPQARMLLDLAREGRFDIVLAEALDRLSRDQEDIAGIHKRLSFAGVRLVTVSEGEVGELHIGLKGTMNALFLRDLAAKVRRGQKGRVADGYSAGGLAYGYAVVRDEWNARGEPVRGKRAVDAGQAETVRRIFREYAAGLSARQIARGLNRDGVPGPAGGLWRVSAIQGNRARGSGILWNEAYRGRLVYNRLRMVKDPDTGRRVSRPNPRDEWVIVEAPDLRIVDDETWAAVQAVHERFAPLAGARPQRRPRHLLSGLLRCGRCGGAVTVYATDKAGCGTRRDAGGCDNDRTVRVSAAEARVLAGLRDRLLQPRALAAFVETYEAERRRLRAESAARRTRGEARIRELEKLIENLVDAIAEGVATPATKRRLVESEAELARLQAEAGRDDDRSVVRLHPAAVAEYRRAVENLFDALATDDTARAEAAELLRAAVDRVDVVPLEGRGRYELHVVTRIEALLELAGTPSKGRLVGVVAGARYRLYQPTAQTVTITV